MARTKQTARKSSGRKSIAKKKALAIMAPATKSHTSKRKAHVPVRSKSALASETSDIEDHSSGQPDLEDTNTKTENTSDSPSSAIVSAVRAVRASYDQAPKYLKSI